eukprot:5937394-Prymnesium_polylepis.1
MRVRLTCRSVLPARRPPPLAGRAVAPYRLAPPRALPIRLSVSERLRRREMARALSEGACKSSVGACTLSEGARARRRPLPTVAHDARSPAWHLSLIHI